MKPCAAGTLDTLLDLHDQVLDQGDGYWISIMAWRTEATPGRPQGVRYSLTLHEPRGERILGYDNAHAIKPRHPCLHAGTRRPFDHRHRHPGDTGVPYEFRTADQLLADFFREVDRVLSTLRDS